MPRKKMFGNEIGRNIDTDRMTFVWSLFYKNVYSQSLIGVLFDFDNIKEYECSLKSNGTIEKDGMKKFVEKYQNFFHLSGDADFGCVKGLKAHIYPEECAIVDYEDFIAHMHQFYNFSLCPVNAGMNMKKGLVSGYGDCFPLYLYYLNGYYKLIDKKEKQKYIEDNLGNPALGGRPSVNISQDDKWDNYMKNIQALSDYLDLFDDFHHYCREVFFFGYNKKNFQEKINEMIDELLSFGEIIDNNKEYEKQQYLDMAIKYWRMRYEIIMNLLNE